jgi:hypothetical protein
VRSDRWLAVLAVLALALPAAAQEAEAEKPPAEQPPEPPPAQQPEAPAEAAKPAAKPDRRMRFHGEVRFRDDVEANYSTFNDDSGVTVPGFGTIPDDTVSFWPYRVRLALEAEITERLIGMVEVQVADVAGGDPAQRDVLMSNDDPFDLYQGFIHWNEIGGSHTSLRVGRQELVLGNGFLFGDEPYYNGVSFDALRLYWGAEDAFHAQFWWAEANETFEQDADTDILTLELGGKADRGDDFSFYLHYVVDDEVSGIGRENLLVLGIRWGREKPGTSHYLWNLELAWQDGRIGKDPMNSFIPGQDSTIAAWGGEGWFGYNFHTGASDQKLTVHGYLGTGERDLADSERNDFQVLFQDVHPRLGRMDLVQGTNIESLGLAYEGLWRERHGAGVDLMAFRINQAPTAETQLALPAGDFSGAGFIIPATEVSNPPDPAADELGSEIDLWYDYYYSENLAFQVLLGAFLPGDAITQINVDTTTGQELDDPAWRVAAQARLRF